MHVYAAIQPLYKKRLETYWFHHVTVCKQKQYLALTELFEV